MKHFPRPAAPDKTVWVATDHNKGETVWFTDENEAFDFWAQELGSNRDLDFACFNSVEGWSRSLNDEFAERNERELRSAASWSRHVESYRRPA